MALLRYLKGPFMRNVLLSALVVVSAIALAAPATAAPALAANKGAQEMEQMAKTMNDPAMQEGMANAMSAMFGAMMDMRLDGITKAMEPLGGKKMKLHGSTLRENLAHDDPNFEAKMQTQTRTAVRGMGAMATAMVAIMPQLMGAMEKMGGALGGTVGGAVDRMPQTN
jgi:hypothetical protein